MFLMSKVSEFGGFGRKCTSVYVLKHYVNSDRALVLLNLIRVCVRCL